MAQKTVTVTGKVTDADTGEPIPFATVAVKGTQIGGITGMDGTYSVSVPSDGKHTLEFNYLGYSPYTVEVTSKMTTVNAKLSSSAIAIADVVVTGFQNVKKETFAGSSVKIAMDELSVGGGMDVSRMLEGKIAGVSIQNVSSTFGSAPKVRVRGVTSINGENKPLWVVDGVVLEDVVNVSNDQLSSGDPTTLLGSSVAGLNNSDIESMDILKDAAATAMYGARAMNGVIVITTKRGKEGAPRVTYNANFTVRQKPRYENFDIMNSADQMSVNAELYRKGLLSNKMANWDKFGPYGLMYQKINNFNDPDSFELRNDPASRTAFLRKYALANTDWFDLLFTNKVMQEHSVSISSGTEKTRTYGSLSYMNDAGVTIADKVNRYTLNARNDWKISDKISTVLQGVASYRNQYVPGSFARTVDPVRGTTSRNFDINPFSYAYNTSRAVRPYDDNGNLEFVQMNYAPFNILHELQNNWMEIDVIDARVQAELTYNILKNLKWNTMGSLRYVESSQQHTITELSNVSEAYRADKNSIMRKNNPFLWKDMEQASGAEKISVLPKGGFLNSRSDKMRHYNFRTSMQYNKVWNASKGTHELSAFGGMEIKFTDRFVSNRSTPGYMYYDGQRFEIPADYYRMLAYRTSTTSSSTEQFVKERFVAFFVNADYTYDRRYTLSISGRVDGSNQLGSESSARWLPTGTVAAKWNISNEKWMENIHSIDAMGLRASYGLTATMPPTANSSAIFYSSPTYAPGYQQDAIEWTSLPNRNLTWEKSHMLNLGYDLVMFKDRFNFTVEYWNRQSFDLIATIKTSAIGGELWRTANYTDLKSWGVDVTLGGTLVRTKGFQYKMNFTMGYNFDEISGMQTLPQVVSLVRQVGGNKNGYPVNSLFSIPFVGLNPDDGTPLYMGPDGQVTNGVDLQSSTTDYLKYEGPTDPRVTGGWNHTFTWKGLSLNVFFSYQLGNKVRLNTSFFEQYSDLNALSRDFKNRWVEGTGTINSGTQVPAINDRLNAAASSGAYSYNIYNYSSARVANGDFVKLKSVALRYDLPSEWLSKSKFFRTASVQVTGKDLLLIFSDKRLNGQDTEFLNTGGVALPALPSMIVSLTLGF
jgi:TonB-linked SusC/RagA family outer membrane protein